MTKEERDGFYDKVFDAWMASRNPDEVSEDSYTVMLNTGYEPDEISWQDCYPNRGKRKPKHRITYLEDYQRFK